MARALVSFLIFSIATEDIRPSQSICLNCWWVTNWSLSEGRSSFTQTLSRLGEGMESHSHCSLPYSPYMVYTYRRFIRKGMSGWRGALDETWPSIRRKALYVYKCKDSSEVMNIYSGWDVFFTFRLFVLNKNAFRHAPVFLSCKMSGRIMYSETSSISCSALKAKQISVRWTWIYNLIKKYQFTTSYYKTHQLYGHLVRVGEW